MQIKAVSQEDINKKYSLFKIPKQAVPYYDNPNDFAKIYRKCSVLQNYNSTYSASTNYNYKQSK